MNTPGALGQVADALAPHDRFEVDLDLLPLAPSDGCPWIRRHEMIARAVADDGQPVLAPQLSHQLVGVEHVYSQSQDDRVMVTARFLVGTKAEDAILRVHEKIRANMDRIPVGIRSR